MSIETRTQQSSDDILPEGREPDARQDVPSQVAYDKPLADSPESDALPLDGSLTLNDTEPVDQAANQTETPHILTGSEAGGTANSSIEGAAVANAGDPATANAAGNADPSIG